MRSEPRADLRGQIRAMVRAAREARVDQAEIVRVLQYWQFQNAKFVDGAAFLTETLEAIAAAPAELAPDFVSFPEVHERGPHRGRPVKDRIENTRALLGAYKCAVRYNLLTHLIELDTPELSTIAPERRANVEIDWLRTTASRHGLSKDAVCEHMSLIAEEYHPVREWIGGVAWDGEDRISALLDTVESPDPLARTLIRKWILQCAAAVSGGRFRPVGVLVLVGPQGCGKTTWCERLAPVDTEWIGLGMHLDPNSRDSVQQLTRYWISELGEVDATFRRADVAALKAFVDRPFDTYRSAYARREERVPRRTVLFASVNRPRFLVDDTGNRRWWSVAVTSCKWDHGIDTRQLWRQALDESRAGASFRLSAEESVALAASNEQFESIDPLAAELWETWRPAPADVDGSAGWQSLTEILGSLPGRRDRPASKRDANEVAGLACAGVRARSADSGGHA